MGGGVVQKRGSQCRRDEKKMVFDFLTIVMTVVVVVVVVGVGVGVGVGLGVGVGSRFAGSLFFFFFGGGSSQHEAFGLRRASGVGSFGGMSSTT